MIIIKKAKGGFRVQIVGVNHEPLLTSEVLKTKQSCYKNIRATSKDFSAGESVVINDEGVEMYFDLKTNKRSRL